MFYDIQTGAAYHNFDKTFAISIKSIEGSRSDYRIESTKYVIIIALPYLMFLWNVASCKESRGP